METSILGIKINLKILIDKKIISPACATIIDFDYQIS